MSCERCGGYKAETERLAQICDVACDCDPWAADPWAAADAAERAWAAEAEAELAAEAKGKGEEDMSMRQQIRAWRASLNGLGNDARYWDLCRTYGDYSREVYAHLRACAEYQHTAEAT